MVVMMMITMMMMIIVLLSQICYVLICQNGYCVLNVYHFLQIVSAVQYCHQKHTVHRDLKVSVSGLSV